LKKLYTSIVTYEIKLNDDDDILNTLHEQVEGITPVRTRHPASPCKKLTFH